MKIGAEADIIISEDRKFVFKRRIRKSYRDLKLDEQIRKLRTKKGVNLLELCREYKIPVPRVWLEDKFTLKSEFIDGENLDDFIREGNEDKIKRILGKCAFFIAKMHNNNVVHGDLTASNIIVYIEDKEEVPYFIDFGFGQKTYRVEEKAMDIHNFVKSFNATFPLLGECSCFFEGEYLENLESDEAKKIRNRLDKIRGRGRYLKR